MSTHPSPIASGPRVELLLLHPTGSRDPQWTSLAVGVLQWIRNGCAARGLQGSLWPETAIDAQGNRRLILREIPWSSREIRRKLHLVPTAEAVLTLHHDESEGALARLTLEDRRGGRLARFGLPFQPEPLHTSLPGALDTVLRAMDRTPYEREASEILHTADPVTMLATLHALERVVAFEVGVGREEPRRLFEPSLQALERTAGNPMARECLTRLGESMLAQDKPGVREAVRSAYERWSELEPLSPLPPYYLAMASLRGSDHEAARTAFQEAMRRDPLFGPALQEFAVWLANRGFLDQGLSVLRQAFGRSTSRGALMDQAGCLLANAGRLPEAEALFRSSIASEGPPTAYANLARCLLGLGREEESLAVLQKGLSAVANRSQIEILARIAEGSGVAAANARALLRGRIAEGSEDEAILLGLTGCSAELFPDSAPALARRLCEVAVSAEAKRYAHYILLKGRVDNLEARWDAAAREAMEGDAAVAEAFFREIVAAEPDFARAQFLLGSALDRQGRIVEARPHAERAAEGGEGEDPLVLDLLARARAESGDLSGAAQAHHRAAALAPQNSTILRNAAITLLRAGYPEEGMGLAGASLALDPEQEELRDLLQRVRHPRSPRTRGMLSRLQRFFSRETSGAAQ